MQALIGAAGQPYTQSLSRADLGTCSRPFLDGFEASEIDWTGFMGTEAVCGLVPLGTCQLEFMNICWVFRWSSHTSAQLQRRGPVNEIGSNDWTDNMSRDDGTDACGSTWRLRRHSRVRDSVFQQRCFQRHLEQQPGFSWAKKCHGKKK